MGAARVVMSVRASVDGEVAHPEAGSEPAARRPPVGRPAVSGRRPLHDNCLELARRHYGCSATLEAAAAWPPTTKTTPGQTRCRPSTAIRPNSTPTSCRPRTPVSLHRRVCGSPWWTGAGGSDGRRNIRAGRTTARLPVHPGRLLGYLRRRSICYRVRP